MTTSSSTSPHGPLRVGIGGPVGSGKTALTLQLCRRLRERVSLGVVTNDIFTREDAEFLTRNAALPADRIAAVETGGCPHAVWGRWPADRARHARPLNLCTKP